MNNDEEQPFGNRLIYAALYRPEGPDDWLVKPRIDSRVYQRYYDFQDRRRRARHPVFVNSFFYRNKRYFSVIFADRRNAGIDRHDMTLDSLQENFDDALAIGLKTGGVAGYDGAGSEHRFIGFWH